MKNEASKIDVSKLEEEFYSKKFYMSYSGLNKLLYSPRLFYTYYILKQREEKIEPHLVEGKAIHCLLLDNGSFENQFVLCPDNLPTGNAKLVADRIFEIYKTGSLDKELKDFQNEIISILKEINLHQSLKTDTQRVDKIITDQNHAYLEFMKIKGDRDVMDHEMFQYCSEAVGVLRNNNEVCNRLGLLTSELDNIKIYNEKSVLAETPYHFGIKGIIDNIKINHDEKIVYINDLKRTSKSISDFPETVEYYNYWLQGAMYKKLASELLKDIITHEWKVIFTFIVIDKYQQVYPFEVSTATMSLWEESLAGKLNEAQYHYSEKKYNLPYRFATSKVLL